MYHHPYSYFYGLIFLFMKKIFVILFLCFWGLHIYSQTRKIYSTDNGLSNSLINQVYQDKRGFIWVATEYGLNKFDGTKFSIYSHREDDHTSINNNYVRCVYEDRSGNVYIGTLTGMIKYDRASDSFEEIRMLRDDKQIHPHVISMIELHNGDIMITTSGQGVFSIKNGTNEVVFESELTSSLNSIYLNVIYEDSSHNIWIGSESEGLNHYNPRTGKITIFQAGQNISSNNITAITEDDFGNIFVGTLTKGLSRFDPISGVFRNISYQGASNLFVRSLLVNDKNQLFIGTDGQGVKSYNREKNVIEDYVISTPFDFSRAKVHSIMQDKDQNLWFGLFQKGIIFIPALENKFNYYGFQQLYNNPIGSGCVTAIYKDQNGITWVGTDNDGLYGVDENNNRKVHFHKTASPNSVPDIVNSIYEDIRGNLWIGSYTQGLAKLNRKTGDCQYIQRLSSEKVYCITEDPNGNLLAGTYGSGIFILDRSGNVIGNLESSKQETDVLTLDELANDWVNCMMYDKDGLLWIGHYKGVSCYDSKSKSFLKFLNQNNLLPGTVVIAMLEDESGKIWIGTTTGLHCFDKQSCEVQSFTTAQGLSNDVICGICQDEENNLWISTYKGINKYNIGQNRFIAYFANDGLQGNEFAKGAFFKDRDGLVFFGGVNGVTSFYPDRIQYQERELDILLTNFYLFNKPIHTSVESGGQNIVDTSLLDVENIRLAHYDNTFSFEFSTLDFSNPERISYQYMIEGVNSEWLNTYPGVNMVTYNNLPPGFYSFLFRANDNGNYSPVKTIHVTITPPWYQTWWAYTFYGLCVVFLLLGITAYIISRFHYRQELMEKTHAEQINEAKLQFFINISHEIRTPLTLIINPLEKIISDNRDSELQKMYLMIYRNAQRILRLINQLMDVRKLDKGQMRLNCRETDIVGFIRDLMITFEYQAKRKNINFSFEYEDPKLMVWIDLNNFDKVLLNILSNSFKFTPDHGDIKVVLTKGSGDNSIYGEYFEISVSDTGIGIDEDKIEKIFDRFYQINNESTNVNFGTGVGLHLSRSLVKLHQGVIFAENRADVQGSRFVIRLPLGNAHFKPDEIDLNLSGNILSNSAEKGKNMELFEHETEEDDEKPVKSKSKYHILIVEDEDEIRHFLKNELSSEFHIHESKNGKEALDFILKEKPDLIISDVMMPVMDGITLVKKIKQNININHIPVILLTARSSTEEKIEGLGIGADAYLVKPFNIDVLKKTAVNLVVNRERLKNNFSGNQEQNEKIRKIDMKSSDEILMEKIMKTINDNISNPDLNVDMLAKNVGFSRVHMHRKLKELTNQSARDFIRGIRLKQAAALLLEKELAISEVAYATGFVNLSHFSNSFKEFHGMSPKEYIVKMKSS